MKFQKATLLLLVAALALMTSPVWAQDICQGVAGNLVANCGFETGDFTGWSLTGNTGFTGVSSSAPYVFSGTYGAQLGPIGSDGFLTQNLWGNSFTFAYRQDPAYWGLDSVVVQPFLSCGVGCELYYVSFYLYNDGGTPNDFTVLWNGADVGPSLVDANGFAYSQYAGYLQGTTPEPSSLILMGSGLLGLAGMVRRKLRA